MFITILFCVFTNIQCKDFFAKIWNTLKTGNRFLLSLYSKCLSLYLVTYRLYVYFHKGLFLLHLINVSYVEVSCVIQSFFVSVCPKRQAESLSDAQKSFDKILGECDCIGKIPCHRVLRECSAATTPSHIHDCACREDR